MTLIESQMQMQQANFHKKKQANKTNKLQTKQNKQPRSICISPPRGGGGYHTRGTVRTATTPKTAGLFVVRSNVPPTFCAKRYNFQDDCTTETVGWPGSPCSKPRDTPRGRRPPTPTIPHPPGLFAPPHYAPLLRSGGRRGTAGPRGPWPSPPHPRNAGPAPGRPHRRRGCLGCSPRLPVECTTPVTPVDFLGPEFCWQRCTAVFGDQCGSRLFLRRKAQGGSWGGVVCGQGLGQGPAAKDEKVGFPFFP